MALTAPITVTTNIEDTLNILNANTLTGNIGAGGAAFNLIKVGQNGNTTINGNIFATTTEFFGNNALTLATNKTITGAVDTTVSGDGILNFAGVGTVTGAVGGINKLGAVNIQGGVGNLVTFDGTVGATNINVKTPSVLIQFNKSVFGNVNFTNTANAASTIIFQNNANMNGNIDNTTGNASIGTVAFTGNSTVTGTIGNSNSVDEIQLAGAGGTVNFLGNINVGAGDLFFTANATANIGNNVSILGNVDSNAANQGNLNFLGNGNMLGTIGATNKLAAVDLSGGPGTTVFFGGDIINATPIIFKADGIANINNGVTVSGTIDTTVAGTGTVQFLGNATVNGVMGATGLRAINILGPTGSTVTFNQDIKGNTPLNFLSNGTASIADGKAINNVNNISGATTGILAFQGGGIVANIGATTPLNLVSVNTLGGAKVLTFDGTTVNANTVNVVGAGGTTLAFQSPAAMNINANITTNNNGTDTIEFDSVGNTLMTGNIGTATNHFGTVELLTPTTVTMNGNIFANNIQFKAASTLQIGDGFSVFGPITTTAGNQGIVTYLGSSTIGFPIGAVNAVNAVNINGPAGSVVNLNAAVNTNNFTVNNGGTLLASNNGAITSVNPVTINNGVLDIAPNTTLNITGALVMNNANATLQMDMGNSLSNTGKIVTTGNATVQAPAKLTILNPGFSPGKSTVIPIVVAGGVGAYAPTITNANTFLTQFSTLVTGNTLNLVVTSQTLASVADQSNTAGLGGALDSISTGVAPGELGQIIGQLASFGDQASLNFDLSTLAPTVDGALLAESFGSLREVYDSIDERFDRNHFWRKKHPKVQQAGVSGGDGPDQNTRWVKVIHQHANQDLRDDVAGYKDDMWGLIAGGDTYIQDNMMLGVAFSWTNLDIRDKLIPYFNRTTANSFQATVYGSMDCNSPYFFDGVVSVAYNEYATQREIIFGSVNLFPRGEFHAWQTGAKAETGYVFDYGDYHAIPVASLLYSHLDVSAYNEKGAGTANQNIAESDFDMLLAGVGIKGTYDYGYDAQRVFQIQAHAMAFFDFINDKMELTSQFVGAGPNFVTSGFRPARESFNLGGSLTLFNQKNWTFTASYDFDFKEDYTANAAFMRARYEW
jgi:outer membrane autotransporter protein